jgi:tRNA pseudouridine38/39 synthase
MSSSVSTSIDELWHLVDASSIAGRALRHLINAGKVSTNDAIDAVARATTQHETSTVELEELDDIINESNSATDEKADGPPSVCKSGEGIKGPEMTAMNNGTLEVEELKVKAFTSKANINKKKERTNNNKNKYRTRHIALQFCYDGTQYSGYAQNIGKDDDKSVERTLFAALEKTNLLISPPNDEHVLGGKEQGLYNNNSNSSNISSSARSAAKYSRCGRTDKGVHAHGQVIALHLRSAFHPLAQRIVPNGYDNSNNNSSNDEEMQPQTLMLDEEELPKNSFDSLTCLVPTSTKSTTKSNNKSSSTTATPSTTTTMEQKTITELDYPKILNGVLPSSIRILGWCPVSSQFSARFSCSNRTYRYYFPHRTNLDLSCMAKGLQYMMGRHDFRNFCKMNCEQVYNFERVIISGTIISPSLSYHVDESTVRVVAATCPTNKKEEEEMEQQQISSSSSSTSCRDMCHIEIVGQAFLWHQIRCIMSILFYIGRKQEVPEIVHELLDVTTNPAKPAYDMASETALVLHHCEYSNINFGRSVRNLWDVTKTLERQWEEYAIATERIRDALDSLVGNTAIQVRYMDLKEFIEKIADSRANKMMKKGGYNTNGIDNVQQQQQQLLSLQAQSNDDLGTLSWGEAIIIIQNTLGIYPYPPDGISHEHKVNKGLTETTVHIPIMDRARGTTYEEKVQSIISSSRGNGATTNNKRKERYEQNIVKKRKTTEEDTAFYNHMLQQGGSSI